MKLKLKYCLTCLLIVILTIILMEIRYRSLVVKSHSISPLKNFAKVKNKTIDLEREITLVLRYDHHSTKQVTTTVNSFLSVFPSTSIVIVSDAVIPREIYFSVSNRSRIINVPLKLDLLNLIVDRNVGNFIKTKYTFIAPIGVLSLLQNEMLNLINVLNKNDEALIAVPVKKEIIECLNLKLNLLQWTVIYKINNSSECTSIKGSHGILLLSKNLRKVSEPFLLPFPEAFYIQTTLIKLNVKLMHDIKLKFGKDMEKHDINHKTQIRRQIMNKILKVKKVHREDGTIEWYGCTRSTPRCFPSIINSIPEYLNQGRWTPPCCLKVLRETVHHVFKILKDSNVTFWLEGGSLLGAMRMRDIIPWDYDVDIGIYLKDIDKCPWLHMVNIKKSKKLTEKNAQLASIVDNQGYVWEKSSPDEGDFYRVQASIHNHMHVDIFPFFSKNGIMTKKTWFHNHPQDMEFPEHYLMPLTTIDFAGIEAPAPNNIKEFLELKFGKGCVENPQYPNSKLFPFPDKAKLFVINETYNLISSP